MGVQLKEILFKVEKEGDKMYQISNLVGVIKASVNVDVGTVLNEKLQFQKDIDVYVRELPSNIKDQLIKLHGEIQQYINKNLQITKK